MKYPEYLDPSAVLSALCDTKDGTIAKATLALCTSISGLASQAKTHPFRKMVPYLLPVLFALLILFPAKAYSQPFSGNGDGTPASPYLITSWTHLNEVRNHLDAHFRLSATLSQLTADYNQFAGALANNGSGWLPIGTEQNPFTGSFDGNNNAIVGLFINRATDNIGLFGFINQSVEHDFGIRNLTFRMANVTGATHTGILAGNIHSVTTISNITFSENTVTGAVKVGPLAGRVTAGTFTRIVSRDVSVTGNEAGGIAGAFGGDLSLSYAFATVSGSNDTGALTGVLTGSIVNSHAISTGVSNLSGGLTGAIDGGSISQSYAVTDAAQGLAGRVGAGGATITDSYWDTNVGAANTTGGGTGRSTSQMQGTNASTNLSGFNFATTWSEVASTQILSGSFTPFTDGYPVLTGNNPELVYFDQLEPMVLQYDLLAPFSSGFDIALPLSGATNVLVKWGDGTSDRYTTAGTRQKLYPQLTSYTVRIFGRLEQFGAGSTNIANVSKFLGITSFGDLQLSSLSGALNGFINATFVPDQLPPTVTNTSFMFRNANRFNQDISSWNVSNVTNMQGMFADARSFNQDLSSWDVRNVTNMTDMFLRVTLSTGNYNNLLVEWNKLPLQSGVTFNGGNARFGSGAPAAARQNIITTYSWIIIDGGPTPADVTVVSVAETVILSQSFPVVVELQNTDGTPVNYNGEVSLSVASGAGALSGTSSVTASNGTALFTNLALDARGTHVLLIEAFSGEVTATSGAIEVMSSYIGGPGRGDIVLALEFQGFGPQLFWTGVQSRDWFDFRNWQGARNLTFGAPTGNERITIPGEPANQPVIADFSTTVTGPPPPPTDPSIPEIPSLEVNLTGVLTMQQSASITVNASATSRLQLSDDFEITQMGTPEGDPVPGSPDTRARIILEPGARYLNLSSAEPFLEVRQRLTGNKGWRMVGAPVATSFHSMFEGLVLQGFAGSDFPDLQPNLLWWDETDGGTTLQHWRQPGSRNQMIPPGRGHFHYVFNGAGRLNSDGNPSGQNYTDVLPKTIAVDGIDSLFARAAGEIFNFPVTFTARDSFSTSGGSNGGGGSSPDTLYLEINQANAGWNLLANPTPSFLDWGASSGWTRTGIGPTIYVWDPAANSGNGDYLIWNHASNTGTLHGGGGGGSGILAPYQAFWVQATCEDESCPEPVLSISRQALSNASAPFLRKSAAPEEMHRPYRGNSSARSSARKSNAQSRTSNATDNTSEDQHAASGQSSPLTPAGNNSYAPGTDARTNEALTPRAVLTLRVQQQELSTSALMVFTPEGSVGYDPSDAPRLMPMNDTWIAVYTRHPIANAAPLHLNHLPYYPGESQWSVDLEVAAYREGMPVDDEFELSWELSEDWPDHLHVYLVDHRLRALVPLSRTETYSFTHQTTLGVLARGLITNSVDRGGDNGRAGYSATKLPTVDATHGAHSPGGASKDGRSEPGNGFQDDITQHNWLSAWSIHPRYPTTVSGGPGAVLPPGPVLGTVLGALNHGAMGRTLPGVNSKDTASRFQILIRDTETDVYLPEEPFLSQNFPNPFNPVTTIAFGLPADQHVRIDIYDITGRLLTSLANGSYPAGTHQVRWNAANYASGVYLVRMQAEGSIQTRKMTLIK
jgi:surface protein